MGSWFGLVAYVVLTSVPFIWNRRFKFLALYIGGAVILASLCELFTIGESRLLDSLVKHSFDLFIIIYAVALSWPGYLHLHPLDMGLHQLWPLSIWLLLNLGPSSIDQYLGWLIVLHICICLCICIETAVVKRLLWRRHFRWIYVLFIVYMAPTRFSKVQDTSGHSATNIHRSNASLLDDHVPINPANSSLQVNAAQATHVASGRSNVFVRAFQWSVALQGGNMSEMLVKRNSASDTRKTMDGTFKQSRGARRVTSLPTSLAAIPLRGALSLEHHITELSAWSNSTSKSSKPKLSIHVALPYQTWYFLVVLFTVVCVNRPILADRFRAWQDQHARFQLMRRPLLEA